MSEIITPLRTLEQKRQFLKDLRIGPEQSKIEFLQDALGKQIPIDQASEIQIDQVLEMLSWTKK